MEYKRAEDLTGDDMVNDEVLYRFSMVIIDFWKSKGLINDGEYSRMLNFIVKQRVQCSHNSEIPRLAM